ncbi:hypothetical protein L1277_001007 [Okibacterium sp. HSC-33S16]|uniref:hypothetical protein n=1 Tax=Okibacterium sp. HSC-33S16 TaxID=2910965 RepID=UPI0020A1DB19|nr:hypothetical protein [Okibacterium sp. HSC-33S16]MCP2030943.1 hypothetical protein [Okibacterium sp. HSC-33S16]
MSRGLIHALAERRSFIMLVGPETRLEALPDLPWELLPSPLSPTEFFTGRRLNSIGADVMFSPTPTWGGFGRRYGLVIAGGVPHVREGATWSDKARLFLWRFPLTRSLMTRRADVIVGVSRAQERSLLTGSATGQPVITLHSDDTSSDHPAAWRAAAQQLEQVLIDLDNARRSASK